MNNIFLSQKNRKFWLIFLLTGLLAIIAGLLFSNPIPLMSSNGCGSTSGGPTDNPITTKYGDSVYSWTQEIKWNCVYNIKDFPGSAVDDQFIAARDTAAKNGGGVVYFPGGIYNFKEGIKLKNGVVIRGENPQVTDAKSDNYTLLSQLVFPKYEPILSGNGTPNDTAFKNISTTNPDQDSNIGVVNLDINRGAISLLGNLNQETSKNIVIFGDRSNNVALPDPKIPADFQPKWVRYSYRFAANIEVNGQENVLVANNRVNDNITDNYEQPGYQVKSRKKGEQIITYTEGWKVPFHYGNHYGIVVNRSKPDGFQIGAIPETEPGLFRKGIVIRDNWVYHTMRVAIIGSGDGLIIKDNIVKDENGKQWWTDPTGTQQIHGATTLENRAIDWSGWNVIIEGNNYQVFRHKIADTIYLSVDGEGILIQECCGGTIVNGAKIIKNQGNAYLGLYKVQDMKNVEITENVVDKIFVSADRNKAPHKMDNVKIENNQVETDIIARASLGGNGNTIKNNVGGGQGKIKYSCHIQVEGNTGFTNEPCFN